MSKTIQTQIDKSRMLIDGLRHNEKEVAQKGITAEAVNRTEDALKRLAEANDECDALRATLSKKVKNMNDVLAEVKTQFIGMKRIIKNNYLQEEWQRFGVQDKR